jgi:demethylmenaquinone methyltransferase/2-methoxy-6-polyprenyl-1,4-benzoquinol methylase
MSDADQALVDQQIRYYRSRAPEYDQWFYRQGQYDHGPEHTRLWRQEIAEVRGVLDAWRPSGRKLELACGTGLWTGQLARSPGTLTAVDASSEVLALNRARVQSEAVRYHQCDIFRWEPDDTYDFVFFGFWLSHVPPSRFAAFWDLLRSALAPGGTVFFVDNGSQTSSPPRDHTPARRRVTERRTLNDGRAFEIVKVLYEPDGLVEQLEPLGWRGDFRTTANFFIYGSASLGVDAPGTPPVRET